MARRKGKSSSRQDDSWLPLESPVGQSSRSFNEYVIPGVLLLIVAVGWSGLGWVCSDHQQMIESLSETLASMQARMAQLQLGPDNTQIIGDFEERLVTLEDAYTKAQKQVELALATSKQIKSIDLQNKVWSLQTEMNNKLAELQQNTFSIAALNAIIKNKSVEFEVVKQSVNTMLSANTELALQIAGFSSTLTYTKLRLDEHILVVDSLMSQLEGQNMEINEMKELFASNQETLAENTEELMDIKELVESEQIKRTQKLEKQLKSLYERLEDHQMTTESLYFHLAAQLEALQTQFLPGVQQHNRAAEDIQVEDQATMTDNKDRKAAEKEMEKVEEDEMAGKNEIKGEDRVKEIYELNTEQEAVEENEASKWPVEEIVKELPTPLEELDIEIEKHITEGEKEVDITEDVETLQETHTVTNEIEKTVVDEVQTAFKNSELVTVETVEIMNEKVEITDGEEILINPETATMVTSKTEKQLEVSDAHISDVINEEVSEEHDEEHTAEKIASGLNEISIAQLEAQDGTGAQDIGSAVDEIQVIPIKTDTTTNGNIANQMTDVIPAEAEHEVKEDLTTAPAKKSDVSKKISKRGMMAKDGTVAGKGKL